MTTCLGPAPQTTDAFWALIDTCAQQYGGADWAATAILGAQALALLVLVVALVGVVVGRRG